MLALPYMEVNLIVEGKIVEFFDNLGYSWGCSKNYPRDFELHLDPNLVVGIKDKVVAIQVDKWFYSELPLVVQQKEVIP